MIPNLPKSPAAQYMCDLYLSYDLSVSPTTDQIKSKAVELLGNENTRKAGIELVMGREVTGAEFNALTDAVFLSYEDSEKYYNQLLSLKLGVLHYHHPELYLKALFATHNLGDSPSYEQVRARAIELLEESKRSEAFELILERPMIFLGGELVGDYQLLGIFESTNLTPEETYLELINYRVQERARKSEA